MRTNLPVTGKEVMLKEGEIIVSKTNLKGQITYINQTFLDIAGFTEQEVMGEPHNIVRHPDMPAEAFADLWDCLKAGRPWSGYVKNRCKNGDHYWVKANAAPIYENGTVTGYMSVREAASRDAIAAHEAAYAKIRAGKSGLVVVDGQGLPDNKLKLALRKLTLAHRATATVVVLIAFMALVGWMGLRGMGTLVGDTDKLYGEHVVEIKSLKTVADLYAVNIVDTAHKARNGNITAPAALASIAEAKKGVAGIWPAYAARTDHPPTERALIDAISAKMKAGDSAVTDLETLLRAGDNAGLAKFTADKLYPAIDPIGEDVGKMIEVLIKGAEAEAGTAHAHYDNFRNQALVLVLAAALAGLFLAWRLVQAIRAPIAKAEGYFKRFAEGKLDVDIPMTSRDEMSKVTEAAKIMQVKLGYDIAEEKIRADAMTRIKIALDNVSTGVMIADANRDIIYINSAVQRILKNAEPELKKALPTFNADKLVGESIDQFHKNPKHQADLLGNLKTTYVANLNIGSLHMRVTASPVLNERGDRLGAVAEWLDRTPEVMVEQEVESLIAAAGQGNFDTRLTLEGKDGFFRKLSEGLNKLSETVSIGLNDVARVLKSIAQGDLTQSIDGQYEGIFGELKDDTNTTIERLREVVGQIKEATDLINTAAKEIAAGNTDLSSRTEEQASSLEETASSMEELNSTVKQNAENASQANQLARNSNDTAVKSGQMVQQIVSTMNGISESSRKIADIIGVIDSIAFQTNILALNAAVEAARAGEQGRGFAVVATEVRNLAQRSATAAKEIKELIAESTGKVDAGTKLVDEAGDSMEAVVASFQQVTGLVTDIANASREQASGIEQVTQAVGQMDEVTQQNAALVEEAAAAAESLEEQARALVQAVSMFKLDGNAARATTTLPGPALRDATPRSLPPGKAAPKTAIAKPRPLPPVTEGEDEWEEF